MAPLRRRLFLAAVSACIASPLLRAQHSKMPVIGFLNGAAYELSKDLVQAFHQGLGEAGYVEGRDVAFEYRSAEGRYDRLPALAADLVQRKVSLIAATGTPTGLPAKAATTTIPIVFVTGSDPVEQGLVASHSRPGGNLTGATTLAVELGQKRLEFLRELVPSGNLVGALINPTGPNVKSVLRDLHAASEALRLRIHVLNASTEAELDSVFSTLAQLRIGALIIGTDTFFNSQSRKLGSLTRRYAVPAIYQYREFSAAGGLLSYAGSILDAYRLAGTYAGRILKGERAADLPVQRSTKTELFVNAATARTLGITVPQSILIRAQEIIER